MTIDDLLTIDDKKNIDDNLMIYKHLTTDEKNILKKVLQIKSGFVVLQHQISSTKNNNNEDLELR